MRAMVEVLRQHCKARALESAIAPTPVCSLPRLCISQISPDVSVMEAGLVLDSPGNAIPTLMLKEDE